MVVIGQGWYYKAERFTPKIDLSSVFFLITLFFYIFAFLERGGIYFDIFMIEFLLMFACAE